VAVWGHGVYKTTDGCKTWAKKSNGLGRPENMHCWMIERAKSGNLYCCVTAQRRGGDFPVQGDLYRSTDGGESWAPLTSGLKLGWPTGFAVDPGDEKTIWLAAASPPRRPEGGLYKTADGGQNWTRVVSDKDIPGWANAFYVTLSPNIPGVMYLSTLHGLWLSRDGGKTWGEFKGIPLAWTHRVRFDPEAKDTIWVNTFGAGIWYGPALGEE
jgi:hypothetical protein